ncbi:MAG: response regulator, partial [Rhodospirillaceae bacterium]|nr:response regulator [Rhodospirillaceae bacterium]
SLILYVEDNPSNLTLMGAIVDEISNLTMISAHPAELGLGLAKDRKPDVIILDINLPGMDGFGALRHLQELEATRSIPVLALSADAYAGRSGTGTRNGFSALSNETSSCVEIDCRSRGCFGRDGMNGQYQLHRQFLNFSAGDKWLSWAISRPNAQGFLVSGS